MNDIEIQQPEVTLRKSCASDSDVIEAMLVSTLGDEVQAIWDEEGIDGIEGRIRYLMNNRHGSPFEHTFFKFFVKAPITVFREFHRHRIGFSYNEQSGRYMEMKPEFYVPPNNRPLTQTGKPGAYIMSPIDPDAYDMGAMLMIQSYEASYGAYRELLDLGWAKEAARGVLPVNLFSSMYASCNARSIMSFLSLRVDEPTATFPSKPMWEIDVPVAREMEKHFAKIMPITHQAFVDNGRVSP